MPDFDRHQSCLPDSPTAGRFLDGQLTLLLSELVDPGPGYAVNLITGRIWRNGVHVGDAFKLSYDHDALGWWVDYLPVFGSGAK